MATKIECERVAELLPWLKNRTLEGAELLLVREHLAHCQECQRESAETTFAWSVYLQHVPAEVLVDLAYGRPVVGAQHELFDRHLSACSDCAEQLDMVRASRRLEAEEEKEAKPGVVVPLVRRVPVGWQRTPVWQYGAIAATLLLVIAAGGWLRSWQQARNLRTDRAAGQQALQERLAGLEAENQRLRQAETQLNQQQNRSNSEIAQLQSNIKEAQVRIQQQQDQINRELTQLKGPGSVAPQINVLALDIYPLGMTQRDGGVVSNEIAIPRNVRAVTLMLHSQASSESPSYSIEIVNARGRAVWKAQGLLRNATNDYTISVAAESLTPGRYTINIYGKAAAGRIKVESYEINVKKL